jgi:hypothetical protein
MGALGGSTAARIGVGRAGVSAGELFAGVLTAGSKEFTLLEVSTIGASDWDGPETGAGLVGSGAFGSC